MVNFNSLTAEIGWRVWGTPANFNGYCVWLHYFQQHLTEGAVYIVLGGHYDG